LVKLLDAGSACRLTIVAAPSGYGKTTAVADWARQTSILASWLSLDSEDNDPIRFWNGIVASIQAANAFPDDSLRQAMNAFPHQPIEVGLDRVAEQLHRLEGTLSVVLDDYHLIRNPDIHLQLSAWLDRLPPLVRVLIVSRAEPGFPLARLRASGRLLELGISDLRFDDDEADSYLNDGLELGLLPADMTGLIGKTEGWIAGIKLMAMAMDARGDCSAFIDSVNGSERFIMDYLTEEVLSRQPEQVQHFLLRTSVLDRMSASLCNQLTGRTDSGEILAGLEKANLFIVPLDSQGSWYRYHHLFAEFLRDKLRRLDEKLASELIRQAAIWLQENARAREAIQYWLEAAEYARAGELIGELAPYLLKEGSWSLLKSWLDAMPSSMTHESERLSITYAWSALLSGQSGESENALRKSGRALLKSASWTGSPEAQSDWLGEASLVRMMAAFCRNDLRSALIYAKESVERKTVISDFIRIGIDLNAHETRLCRGALGMSGHLRKAASYLKQMESDVAADPADTLATGYSYAVFGEIMYEWNRLPAAEENLLKGVRIGETSRNPGLWVPAMKALIGLKDSLGNRGQADELLVELVRSPIPAASPLWADVVEAFRIERRLSIGEYEEAAEWLERTGAHLGDSTLVIREYEHLVRIRILRALGKTSEAIDGAERLWLSAEKKGRKLTLVELVNLQALIHRDEGRPEQATARLRDGLRIAEREGYVRSYADEGEPMAELLRHTLDRVVSGELRNVSARYIRMLLSAFGSPKANDVKGPRPRKSAAEPFAESEELSARQWEILDRVLTGATNQRIADDLFISVGTLKIHLNRIYKKLNVDNREQAISWAEREKQLRESSVGIGFPLEYNP
jgi:LuxR family maltose regulon positive regulatory protein